VFDIKTEELKDFIVVFLKGRVDVAVAEKIDKKIHDIIDSGKTKIIIDFSYVTYFSSSGMRVIINLKNSIMTKNGILRLCNLQSMVAKILKTLELTDFYEIYENVEDAIKGNK